MRWSLIIKKTPTRLLVQGRGRSTKRSPSRSRLIPAHEFIGVNQNSSKECELNKIKHQQQQQENGNEGHPLHPSRNNSANNWAVWRDRLQSLRRTPTKTTASPGPDYAWKTITNSNNWTHNNWPVAHSIKFDSILTPSISDRRDIQVSPAI